MHDPDIPSDDALLRELEALEGLFGPADHSGNLTALIRLVRTGLSWEQVLRQKNLFQWIVLPLGRDKFPALSMLKEHLETLTFQKDHDPLTGLRNRRAFDQALALEKERAGRFKTPLTLSIIDLDNFKAVNDTYGHPCGDKVIQSMASILLSEIRKIDTAARIGGEEFAVILPGTGLARAQKFLERILHSVRLARVECGTASLAFTCSIGVASYRGKHVPDPDRLVAAADQALYRAKEGGKNRIESAPLLDLDQLQEQTQVQQNEKRFLFTSFFAPTADETEEAENQHDRT